MKGLESLRNYQVKTVLLSGIYTMTPLPPKCKYVLIPSEVLREKKAEVTKVCHFLSPPPTAIHPFNKYLLATCYVSLRDSCLLIYSPRKPMNLH